MSGDIINVTVTQGGTIDADLTNVTTVDVQVEQGGQIASTLTGGGKGATGDTGATGATGSQGPQGDPGEGIPTGGIDDQVLRKTSGVDYATEWHTPVKADVGLSNVDNTSDANKPVSTAQATAIGVVQSDINTHEANTSNPHSVTKTQVGLGNADNTSDVNKPVSTATQTALDAKVTGPASVTDDNPAIFDGTTGKLIKQKTYAAFKTLLALVKGDVGLGNVDNTSDTNKPVSTAQQTAIDGKVADAINDGVTTIAPSQNAVFDALANKQPLDTDLTTIAGLTATTDNFMVSTSSAWASRTPTQARSQMGLGSIAVLSTITESEITLVDVTTNNFSTTKHGFVPKGTNVGSFLKDDGTWASVPGGGDALTSNPLSQFAATTSLQLKGVLSDETGSGAAVFANSPALVTPTGIVKGDVGLGNVDNTSDATKDAATATLTNKTLTAPKLASTGFIADANGNEIIKTPATVASAVNELTVNPSATGNAVILEATGGDTNIHLVVRGKGNGLTKVSVLRQDDTTGTYKHNSVTLTGWGVMAVTTGVASANETVTYGITFAQRPIPVICPGGDGLTAGGSAYGTGGNAIAANLVAKAYTVTTTTFVAQVGTGGNANFGANGFVWYHWICTGELT